MSGTDSYYNRRELEWERETDRAWDDLELEFDCNIDYDWQEDELAELVENLAKDFGFNERDVWDVVEDHLPHHMRLMVRRYFDIPERAEKLFRWLHFEPYRILKSTAHRWWYHTRLWECGNIPEYLKRTHSSIRSSLDEIRTALCNRALLEYTYVGKWVVELGNCHISGHYPKGNALPLLMEFFDCPIYDRRPCDTWDIRDYPSVLQRLRAGHRNGAIIRNVSNSFPIRCERKSASS